MKVHHGLHYSITVITFGFRYVSTILYFNNSQITINFEPFQCVPGTWYLATDMQLYLLIPFLVLLMQLKTYFAKLFICSSLIFILIDFFHLAPNIAPFYMEDNYHSIRARIVPWLTGVILGYVLWKMRSKNSIQIPKVVMTSESNSDGTQIITKFTPVSVPEHTSFECINLCIDEAYIHDCDD